MDISDEYLPLSTALTQSRQLYVCFTLSHYSAGLEASYSERSAVDNMPAMTIIEPAQAEWLSPAVYAPEKDGALRICVDYRIFNALIVCNLYPMRWMH